MLYDGTLPLWCNVAMFDDGIMQCSVTELCIAMFRGGTLQCSMMEHCVMEYCNAAWWNIAINLFRACRNNIRAHIYIMFATAIDDRYVQPALTRQRQLTDRMTLDKHGVYSIADTIILRDVQCRDCSFEHRPPCYRSANNYILYIRKYQIAAESNTSIYTKNQSTILLSLSGTWEEKRLEAGAPCILRLVSCL